MDPARVVTNTYIYSAFSIICDFAFALFPIFIIWGLNMNKRSKVALAPIMLMACVLVCFDSRNLRLVRH